MKLSKSGPNTRVVIKAIEDNDVHLMNRLTSIGLTQETKLQVVRNDKKMPVLVFARETLLALNRRDADRIEVEQL